MRKLFLFLALTCSVVLHAEIKLPSVFGDNMILQQNSQAAIWGKAEPNTQITISTTWSKAKVDVFSDENGDWKARVKTPQAGGPYEMSITDGKKLTLHNVMIGEVWICMGQSNMDMTMRGFGGQPVEGSAEYIMQANPEIPIRSFRPRKQPALEPQWDCTGKWMLHDPYGVSSTSAVSYFFARQLYECMHIPVGIINVSLGGSAIEAWMDKETIEREFPGEFNMEPYETGVLPMTPRYTPGLLYNGMLHSVIPFTAKGFIWYHGCSKRKQYELYKGLQTSFVKMLRKEWGNENMPFYFTQIAPYQYEDPNGVTGGYMMWAQAQTLDMIPNSGMAVTHDAGELVCIHPANKQVVGDRLAYQALYNDYGVKGFNPKAPLARKFEFKDGVAYVTIEVDDLGLSPINMQLEGFELAGADKVFYPAKASVTKNRKIIKVECPEVTDPVAVRYGMKNWSEATLFNCFGIPVSPFRSDDWK
jgi:sialate O-acetylesterase